MQTHIYLIQHYMCWGSLDCCLSVLIVMEKFPDIMLN